MRKPILVTGFEPFGGEPRNPSAEVAQALHGRAIGGVRVVGAVLPCDFAGSGAALHDALASHRPRLVLALGLAPSRGVFSLERVAINLIDARIADNAGAQPIDVPVQPGAAAAHFTTLPIKAMVAALREAGHAAEVSHSAGTYVCNQVFFLLQQAARRRRGLASGFMHLPPLANVSLPAQADAVAIALATALAATPEPRASEGALD